MRTRPLRLPDDRRVALELAAEVASTDGQPPLSEHKLVAIRRRTGTLSGVAVVDDDDAVVAYAAAVAGSDPTEWGVEPVIPARHRRRATLRALMESIAASASRQGATILRLWLYTSDMLDDAIALGFEPERTLLLMHRPLPAHWAGEFPDDVTVRGFRVGRDEDRWLEVNNAAFESHPENGNWDHHDLEERLTMPWFDPDGLRMAWGGETLLGFCWTKVHPEGAGEIFIIAAAPQHRGRGIGRALVIEGLRYLAEAGVPEVFLYCEAENAPAVALYESLGFKTDRSHRSLVRAVD